MQIPFNIVITKIEGTFEDEISCKQEILTRAMSLMLDKPVMVLVEGDKFVCSVTS